MIATEQLKGEFTRLLLPISENKSLDLTVIGSMNTLITKANKKQQRKVDDGNIELIIEHPRQSQSFASEQTYPC